MKDTRHLEVVMKASSSYCTAFLFLSLMKKGNSPSTARSGYCHFSANEIVPSVCKRAVIIMLTELFASLCASPRKHSRRHYQSLSSQLTLRENSQETEQNSLLREHTQTFRADLIRLSPDSRFFYFLRFFLHNAALSLTNCPHSE